MQLLGRLMDHVLAQRGERTTIVVATSGDTGGAAVEAFRGRSQVDLIVLYPRRPHLRRAAADDDDGADDANVHALAVDGTFDDCQAIVKGLFNHHAFRDRVRLSGVNSINFARIVAQVVYYFTAAVALGAPHRKIAFTVPTGNFGDVFAGYVAQAHGPAGRPADDRHQRQRHSGAHARRAAPTKCTTWCRPRRRRWTFRCHRISSGCCSTPMAATPRAVRAMMGALAQSRRFSIPAQRARRNPRAVHRRQRRRAGDRGDHPHAAARDRPHRRSTHRGRGCRGRKGNPRSGTFRWSCCRPRTQRNSRMPSRQPAACVRPCPIGFPISTIGRSAPSSCRRPGRR